MGMRADFRRKISAAIYNRDLSYETNLVAWQRSLSVAELGSFAEDYRRGDRDTVTVDAYAEYRRRKGKSTEGRQRHSSAKLPRCLLHKRGQYPKNCEDCRALGEHPLQDRQDELPAGNAIDDPIEGSQAIREAQDEHPAYLHASSISA